MLCKTKEIYIVNIFIYIKIMGWRIVVYMHVSMIITCNMAFKSVTCLKIHWNIIIMSCLPKKSQVTYGFYQDSGIVIYHRRGLKLNIWLYLTEWWLFIQSFFMTYVKYDNNQNKMIFFLFNIRTHILFCLSEPWTYDGINDILT